MEEVVAFDVFIKRYGSCYANIIDNLDDTHPGCRKLIQNKGLSVQDQEKYLCRTAINQRGEQTINRDAKTSGEQKTLRHCMILQTSEGLSLSTNPFDHPT